MEILILIVVVLLAIFYASVATYIFLSSVMISGMANAFGWPGESVLSSLMQAIFWPIILPIAIIYDLWCDWRYDE